MDTKEHDSEFESNNGNSGTKSEQSQVNVVASVEDNVDDTVVDVEHPNVEDEPESAILTEIERESIRRWKTLTHNLRKYLHQLTWKMRRAMLLTPTKTLLWLK